MEMSYADLSCFRSENLLLLPRILCLQVNKYLMELFQASQGPVVQEKVSSGPDNALES